MIRVIVADDHAIVREGLKRIIDSSPGIRVIGEAETGDQVRAHSQDTDFDVLLLDITMPGLVLLDVLVRLSKTRPEVRVLVLSVHPEESYGVRALRAGAAGYLSKERSPEELVAAIRQVHAGRRYISSTLAESLADALDSSAEQTPHQTLSNREYAVFCELGNGKGVTEIATELSLSPKTVSTYRARILQKMGLHSNADLIRYAIENGLA